MLKLKHLDKALAHESMMERAAWKNANEPARGIQAVQAQVAGTQAVVADGEDWRHLVAYGYAPGGYMGRCRACGAERLDLDKRATRCRPCAEAAHAEAMRAQLVRSADGAQP